MTRTSGLPATLCLLLVLSVLQVSSLASFHFTGQFYCPKQHFNYHITLYEVDPAFSNAISHHADVSSYAPHNYQAEGQDDDDGCWPVPVFGVIWCNFWFEIRMDIVHDCTTDGSIKKVQQWIGQYHVPMGNGEVYDTYNIDLNDKGERTTDIIIGDFRGSSSGFSVDETVDVDE